MKFRSAYRRRGFTLLSVLMALMIIGILSGMYLSPPGGGGKGGGIYYIQKTKRVACDANRTTIATQVASYQIANGRFPSIEQLRSGGSSVPACPEGGRYYTLDGQIYCTLHTPIDIPPIE